MAIHYLYLNNAQCAYPEVKHDLDVLEPIEGNSYFLIKEV